MEESQSVYEVESENKPEIEFLPSSLQKHEMQDIK
jgi:hypothetical protein